MNKWCYDNDKGWIFFALFNCKTPGENGCEKDCLENSTNIVYGIQKLRKKQTNRNELIYPPCH